MNLFHIPPQGGFSLSCNFSMRTHVNFTRVNNSIVWKATELREDWEQVKLRDFPSRLVSRGGSAAKKVETCRFEDENHHEYEI